MYLRFMDAMRVRLEKLAQVTQWAVSESPISARGRGASVTDDDDAASVAVEQKHFIIQYLYFII